MTTASKPYDPALPDALKQTQQWFASIISRPMDGGSRLIQTSPSGRPMAIEAQHFIRPSPTMQPHERIEVYNQQYWWRLLGVLQDNHPFLLRLFGFDEFNQVIGIPYLIKYFPDHWSLNLLGRRLPQWIREEYHEPDKALVLGAARIDCTFMRSFVAQQRPRPHLPTGATESDLEQMLDKKLSHQPHVFLFALSHHFFQFRETLVQQEDADYWLTHDFPPLQKEKTYIVVYRTTAHNDMVWKQVSESAYRYLSLFKRGCSINQSLEWLETQDGPIADEVATNLRVWLQEWIALGWFAQGSMGARPNGAI